MKDESLTPTLKLTKFCPHILSAILAWNITCHFQVLIYFLIQLSPFKQKWLKIHSLFSAGSFSGVIEEDAPKKLTFSKYNSRPCIYNQMCVPCSPEECLNLGETKLLSVNTALKLLDTAEVGKITSGFIYQQAQTAQIQRWALSVLVKQTIYITARLQHKGKRWAHCIVFHRCWAWPSLPCSLWMTRKQMAREHWRPELVAVTSHFAEEDLSGEAEGGKGWILPGALG